MEKSRKEQITAGGEGGGCIFHNIRLSWDCIVKKKLNIKLFLSDIWSLGVILFMLVCGRAPFFEANDSETLINIMDVRYQVSDHVSPACQK